MNVTNAQRGRGLLAALLTSGIVLFSLLVLPDDVARRLTVGLKGGGIGYRVGTVNMKRSGLRPSTDRWAQFNKIAGRQLPTVTTPKNLIMPQFFMPHQIPHIYNNFTVPGDGPRQALAGGEEEWEGESERYIPFGEGNDDLPMFVEAMHADEELQPSEVVCVRKGKCGEALAIPQANRYTSRDWMHILKEMPRSNTLRRIKGIVAAHTLWAATLATINKFMFKFPGMVSPTLVTPALALLLVFRTNAAYNRFWEGCQLWSKLTSKSRSLIRYATLYERQAGMKRLHRMGKLISALGLTLKEHLTLERREEREFVENLLLEPTDVESLHRVSNKPLFVANLLAREVQDIPNIEPSDENNNQGFSSRERLAMLRIVDDITGYIGACERIVQTPVPLNYARHTSRFLTFWCLTLPLALVRDLSFMVVPATALVVWSMFGIQEIGLMIEEPFSQSLSLHVFCNTIHHDVKETMSFCNGRMLNNKKVMRRENSEDLVPPPGIDSELWQEIMKLSDIDSNERV
mmetsp:Transcript_30989/g.54372  ORF Transcript_30989/g.54372 Transcript_30989/m.54372 type:complete len:517 (-) Transcript_30989:448-1998(-)|eukprot:CAMPEP_0197532112 /NCGR_PEP_ID=MMETSP1318-20131121/38546_1 /TAXON_ID=552666 /ORGANISM="Partenskyella glossopodia, Strain RCC365" /LENGTH=516 /DNA_ID=CAMNT_0043088575 /DNA_START=84 /DNA_END=1634 /DNA_ORIENTATION=+